jgi:hypothetical protein
VNAALVPGAGGIESQRFAGRHNQVETDEGTNREHQALAFSIATMSPCEATWGLLIIGVLTVLNAEAAAV